MRLEVGLGGSAVGRGGSVKSMTVESSRRRAPIARRAPEVGLRRLAESFEDPPSDDVDDEVGSFPLCGPSSIPAERVPFGTTGCAALGGSCGTSSSSSSSSAGAAAGGAIVVSSGAEVARVGVSALSSGAWSEVMSLSRPFSPSSSMLRSRSRAAASAGRVARLVESDCWTSRASLFLYVFAVTDLYLKSCRWCRSRIPFSRK
mmetsp:Transcript_9446/g.30167  ORF Transcript_9446/g.30167 Transcript_9446/m.30167 type:complete len:203 (-) Transcript_9446:386-994(-)